MTNPFDVWAPIFKAPFSGNVTQEIVPRFLSPEIKGNIELEQKIQTDVASYGKQLGKILEALQTLSTATATPLPDIDRLVEEIEAVKDRNKDTLQTEAEAALAKLKAADETAWQRLVKAS